MTGATLSERDLERLSAYIDGQLTAVETAELEARLAAEPDLKQWLQELRWTAAGLKSLPAHPAPRHYRLTPEMVGQTASGWRLPTLRLATAVVAVALVGLVGWDALQAAGSNHLAGLALGAQAPMAEDAGQLGGGASGIGAANSQPLEAGELDKTAEATPELALRAAVASASGTATPLPEEPPVAQAAPPGSSFEATPAPAEAFARPADQLAQSNPSGESQEASLRLAEILLAAGLVGLIYIQVRRRT
jgi:anti-sigma factor RsiW